jgi:hypothetical protein
LENEPLGNESESISNAVTEVYQSKSWSKWILGIVAENLDGGLAWYGAMRSIQMRTLRIPKPQVARFTKLEL